MSEINAALAGGSEYSFEGQVYRLAPWTYEVRGAFERYILRHALENAEKNMRNLGPERVDKVINHIMTEAGLGLYSWGQEYVAKALDSRPHMTYLIWLQIRKNHPGIELKQVEKMIEVDRAGLERACMLANQDPKSEAPEALDELPA